MRFLCNLLHPNPLPQKPEFLSTAPYILNSDKRFINYDGVPVQYLTPYTLHPTPYTIHPTPYTLTSKALISKRCNRHPTQRIVSCTRMRVRE